MPATPHCLDRDPARPTEGAGSPRSFPAGVMPRGREPAHVTRSGVRLTRRQKQSSEPGWGALSHG